MKRAYSLFPCVFSSICLFIFFLGTCKNSTDDSEISMAIDFPDQPFVITFPKGSDPFGNPQIDPVESDPSKTAEASVQVSR